ncbi:potassium channel family protein [Candidatus Actinomarina]|jgi:voltage-gated potassium channel|nr:potassium channel family protein [Candidatus Actinomarina sp.]MDC1070948.1 potassium channel family protein [Acidimicrobiia bacterium]|tara:strand:- start:2536 stop:3285 length:750 start_codon:yes stop_codon:yes gene_type:complete
MPKSTYQKAEKFFEVPVMVSVLMLIPVLVIEYTQQTLEPVALYLNWGIWTVFLVEYVVLFYFSKNKIEFIKSHKIELIIIIFSFPIVPEGLESSGFLRFARLPRLLNGLRFFRLAALLNRFASTVKSIFNSKGLRFIVYATIGIVLFFGFLFYISEPAVQTYSDGLWWALVTITTVGYGDITPLTNLGRIIASALMIMGIGFIATITAAVSSYFISSFGDRDITMNDLAKKLDKLEVEIQYLKKENNGK